MKIIKSKSARKSARVVQELVVKTRISAEDLFAHFTADIINKKTTFTR